MLTDPDRTPQTVTDTAALCAALEAVRIDLQAAQAGLAQGRTIDLTGVDARIAALCGQALALPAPLARQTLPDLVALRNCADQLIDTLAAGPVR